MITIAIITFLLFFWLLIKFSVVVVLISGTALALAIAVQFLWDFVKNR